MDYMTVQKILRAYKFRETDITDLLSLHTLHDGHQAAL